MMKRSSVLRGSARALTGLALTVAGGFLFLNLGLTEVEPITGESPKFSVNTTSSSEHTAVCQGAFQVLGMNPDDPAASTPVNSQRITTNTDAPAESDAPVTVTTRGSEQATGAGLQRLDLDTVSGLAAHACDAPVNESWIVAGSTERGMAGTIMLTNPGEVPATVRITVHTETGVLTDASSTGVLVPPGEQRTVSLNAFGAGIVSPVIQISSTGAPVSAALASTEIRDIVPTGAALTNAQTTANETLVLAGVFNFVDHSHHTDHEDEPDEFPAVVRLMLPRGASDYANASISALTPNGHVVALAEKYLTAGEVTDVTIDRLPPDALAIIVEATAPVVGGLYTSVHNNNDHDFTWVSPSTVFTGGELVDTVVLKGGELVFVNVGFAETTVKISGADSELTVPGRSAVRFTAPEVSRISSTEPFAMGVLMTNQRELATYPILGGPEDLGQLTVYTR